MDAPSWYQDQCKAVTDVCDVFKSILPANQQRRIVLDIVLPFLEFSLLSHNALSLNNALNHAEKQHQIQSKTNCN